MSNDFDFLTGHWSVRNRRLATLFSGADDWYEFPGVSRAQPLMGGVGNLDEITFPTLDRIGMTLRLFDQERKEWSIYWSISSTGRLYPPMRGVFSGGRGDFYGDDEHEGRTVRAHFIWSHISADGWRWEQEYSDDGGRTWESNWVMEGSRAD